MSGSNQRMDPSRQKGARRHHRRARTALDPIARRPTTGPTGGGIPGRGQHQVRAESLEGVGGRQPGQTGAEVEAPLQEGLLVCPPRPSRGPGEA